MTLKNIKMVKKSGQALGWTFEMKDWVVVLEKRLFLDSENLGLDIMNGFENGDHLEDQSQRVLKKLIDTAELNS